MFRRVLVAAVPLLVLVACVTPPAFPPEVQPISAKELYERLAGSTYTARSANGIDWELRYEPDGRTHLSLSNGATDSGRWRAEDNRFCVEFDGRFPSGCSEMRADPRKLYLKRSSTGEIVALKPKC